jgi:hypothetical protein
MTKEKDQRRKEYSSAREAFDDLFIDEKAFFLLESAAKAVIDGVQEAVDTLAGAMNEAFSAAKEEMKKEADRGAKASKGKPASAKKTAKTTKTATPKAKKESETGSGAKKKAAPKKAAPKKTAPESGAKGTA